MDQHEFNKLWRNLSPADLEIDRFGRLILENKEMIAALKGAGD